MKALAVTGIKELELVEIDKPVPRDGEVLIKVAYCGMCGSDLPRYFDGGVHSFPQILGHEFSGSVAELGEDVTSLCVGDRVAVAPLIPNWESEEAKAGHPQLGKGYSFIGSRQQGAMAEYVAVPADNCIRIPNNVSLKEAAMIEPLTVAIHGVELFPIKAAEKVLILGAGSIGLMTLMTLRAKGAGEIIVIDLNQEKLDFAKKLGADITLNPTDVDLDAYFSNDRHIQYVIETAGNHVTQVEAVKYASPRGNIAYVGTCTKPVHFEPEEFEMILRKELTIKGAWMSYSVPFPGYEWHAAVQYLASGSIKTEPLNTSLYSLEDKALPFEKLVEKGSMEMKVLYHISREE